MKKITLLFLFSCFALLTNGQGLENIIVEKYYVSDAADSAGSMGLLPAGSVTYRIYVDMAAGYKLMSVYGNANHPLTISTNASFFNNEDRGDKTPTYSKTHAKFNTVMLDSWVSMGGGCVGNLGILKTEDTTLSNVVNSDGLLQNDDTAAGIPINIHDGLKAGTVPSITMVGINTELDHLDNISQSGNQVYINNGAWSCLTGSKGATAANRVLIGQLTTKGALIFNLNVVIKDTVNNIGEKYVHSNPITGETYFQGLNYSSNHQPTVIIANPVDGSTFLNGANIAIQAMAADIDGSVKSVSFYADNILLGSDTTFPYSINYSGVYGNHTLHCIAIDDLQDTAYSDTVLIHVGAVGFGEITAVDSYISVYPNPAHDKLNVEIFPGALSTQFVVVIRDLAGRDLYKTDLGVITNMHSVNVDISNYAPGMYILECISEKGSVSHKFSKQ